MVLCKFRLHIRPFHREIDASRSLGPGPVGHVSGDGNAGTRGQFRHPVRRLYKDSSLDADKRLIRIGMQMPGIRGGHDTHSYDMIIDSIDDSIKIGFRVLRGYSAEFIFCWHVWFF